jgi:hypothetical protein
MSRIGVEVPEMMGRATTSAYRQLDLRLTNPTQAVAPESIEQHQSAEATALVLGSQLRQGSLPKHRSLELASDQLLMITVDDGSRLRWWSMMPDPRILRAERPGPNGPLVGEVIYQKSIDLTVNIPDDNGAVQLRFYHPRWTGDQFLLVLISTISLKTD